MIYDELHAELRRRWKEDGISQTELAHQAGLSQSQMARMLKDARYLEHTTFGTILRLFPSLNISLGSGGNTITNSAIGVGNTVAAPSAHDIVFRFQKKVIASDLCPECKVKAIGLLLEG